MQPALRLAVPFVERGNADLEGHRVVGLTRLEATNGSACLQAQIQNYASVSAGLYSGEASAPRGEFYQVAGRKNDDLASGFSGIASVTQRLKCFGRIDDGVAYCPQLRSIRVLFADDRIDGRAGWRQPSSKGVGLVFALSPDFG